MKVSFLFSNLIKNKHNMGKYIIMYRNIIKLALLIIPIMIVIITRTYVPYDNDKYLYLDIVSVIIGFLTINYIFDKIFIKNETLVDNEYITTKIIIDRDYIEYVILIGWIIVVYDLIKSLIIFCKLNDSIIYYILYIMWLILLILNNYIISKSKSNSDKIDENLKE
jgi:hypothetical protein